MWQVFKDGRPVAETVFSDPVKCAAEILVRGWIEPVERFGVVWVQGVEVRKVG